MVEKKLEGKSPLDLFPDLFRQHPKTLQDAPPTSSTIPEQVIENNHPSLATKTEVPPPTPPVLDTILYGTGEGSDSPTDGSKAALLFIQDEKRRGTVSASLNQKGFSIITAASCSHTIKKLEQFTFPFLICDIANAMPRFHNYICRMPISTRRKIYYVLIGRQLRTMYDLEALSLSANQTINYRHIHHAGTIIHIGYKEYCTLYSPFLDVLNTRL